MKVYICKIIANYCRLIWHLIPINSTPQPHPSHSPPPGSRSSWDWCRYEEESWLGWVAVVSHPAIHTLKQLTIVYSWFHIKGTWSVHSFNGVYLSIPEGTGTCGYLFHEIPDTINNEGAQRKYIFLLKEGGA